MNKIEKESEKDELCRSTRRTFRHAIIEQYAKDPTYTLTDMQGELTGLIVAVS